MAAGVPVTQDRALGKKVGVLGGWVVGRGRLVDGRVVEGCLVRRRNHKN